jgi:hypothetical protein
MKTITPGGSRTPNLWFRRPLLYPVELRARLIFPGFLAVSARPANMIALDLTSKNGPLRNVKASHA